MRVQEYSDPKEYLNKVEAFLMQDEVVHSLPLGIALNLAKAGSFMGVQPFMALVSDGDRVQLVMIKTTSHLVLAGANKHAVSAAVDYLSEEKIPVPSIIGTRDAADYFAEIWCQRNNCQATVEMGQRIYRLDSVNPVPKAPGFLRPAEQSDLEFIPRWIHEFAREALNPISEEQVLDVAKTGIADQTIFLWQDGEVVSMAKQTRPTANGITVNLVYTPPANRKKGYATNCVAALSQKLLDQGYKYCSLYTDLANPTSNKIYMEIGYKPVADSVVYQF